MSVRQYIGARYVPRFLGTWNNTTQYEALDVVDNGSGTSYIARKNVPAGTPLTNTEFWFVYGASSGAIIDLQNRMTTSENNLDNINIKLSHVEDRKILFVGDSYAGITAPNGRNYCQIAGDAIGAEYNIVRHAGIGFTNINGQGTFLDYLQTITTDRESYTDIIVCGGCNDYSDTNVTIAAIKTFCDYANENFPNAMIHIGMVGGFNDSRKTSHIASKALPAYRACGRCGAHYMEGLEYIMWGNDVFESDHVHPIPSHIPYIGYAVADAFFGAAYVQSVTAETPTAETGNGFSVTGIAPVVCFQFGKTVGFAANSYRFCAISISDAAQALTNGTFEHKILGGFHFRGFPSGWSTGRYAIPVKCSLSPSNTELYGLLYANPDNTLTLSVSHVPSSTTTMSITPLAICETDFDFTRF